MISLLTYTLDSGKALPLYEQLYRLLREDILQKRLPAGSRLPSKRPLAKHLQVSLVTIETAYAQLIAEGYITAVEKRGYYVSDGIEAFGAPHAAPSGATASARAQATAHVPSAPERTPSSSRPTAADNGLPYSRPTASDCSLPSDRQAIPERTDTAPDCWLDLTSNEITLRSFPFSIWSRLTRQVLSDYQEQLMQRAPGPGLPLLRRAIAGYLYYLRGIKADYEQIIIGSGTEHLYQLLIQLFPQGSIFAMENPGYQKAGQIYRAHHVPYHAIPLDAQGISMDGLRASGASIVHLSPAHHYPTGQITSAARRTELLKWAAEQPGRYILEDEYDSEFRLSGKPVPPMFSMADSLPVIYMNTFSKCISPSIRISYMILPPELLDVYHKRLGFYSCPVPNLEQLTLAGFINDGYLIRHVNRTKTRYRLVRDTLISFMERHPFFRDATISKEEAGLHFLLRFPPGRSEEALLAEARALGIRLQPISDFFFTPLPGYECTFVVNYSSIGDLSLLS